MDDTGSEEGLLKSIRKLLIQRNSRGAKWPRLPVLLTTYVEFSDFTLGSLKAQKLMERVFWLMETNSTAIPLSDYQAILHIIDVICDEYTEFMFTRFNQSSSEFDGQLVEKRLTRGDLPSTWIDSYETCFVIYIRAKFMHHYISSYISYSVPVPAGDVHRLPSTLYSQLSALSFPGVRSQYIAQTSKLISQYTAVDIIWALETLARVWYTITYDKDIESYISALTLRFSTFMSCGMSLKTDFYGGEFPEDNVTGFPAEDLHAEPDKEKRDTEEVCLPSALFRGIVSARIRAFRSVSWRMSFYKTLPYKDLCACVKRAQELTGAQHTSQKRPHEDSGVPQTSLESFDIHRGSRDIAELLFRYATESTTKDVSRELYSKKLAQVYLLPGDVGVFSVLKQNFSKTATNIILTIKGDKYGNELLRIAKTVGMIPVLRKFIDRLKQPIPETKILNRSSATIEEEVGGLAVLEVLFKNRYSVSWIDTYLVTSRNHIDALLYNRDRSVTEQTEDVRLTDTAYKRLPLVVFFTNTFDLFYDNVIYKTSSFFDTIAVWLRIIALVYDSRIPINGCKSHQYGDIVRNGLVLRSIGDLCSVVVKGHSDYVIRADQKEKTKIVTKKIGTTSVKVIETS